MFFFYYYYLFPLIYFVLLKVCFVCTNMCNIIFQRLPAVLSRIGIILASPLVSYIIKIITKNNSVKKKTKLSTLIS